MDRVGFKKLNQNLAKYYRVAPLEIVKDELKLYVDKSRDLETTRQEIQIITGEKIHLIPKDPSIIDLRIAEFYKDDSRQSLEEPEHLENNSNQILKIIFSAFQQNSSDIHLESEKNAGRLRFRIDGQLVEIRQFSPEEYLGLVNQVKILGGLDIAERRLPQDGRMEIEYQRFNFNLRVSTLPTLYGEKVVLRILNKNASSLDINKLGFSDIQEKAFIKAISRPHGLILISGPTGSGKTTSLYASLKLLNQDDKNLLTIEDPVEYTLPGINQVQVKENIGLDFATAMKTFLRQDPDIIMLGEIRDAETAKMAVRAAMTGHLVLSTIHTNSAIDTLNRLIDIEVPAYLINSTLAVSVAQRLVRKLCPHCKKITEQPLPKDLRTSQNVSGHHFENTGCAKCYQTGFLGRTAIYEILEFDQSNKVAFKNGHLSQLQLCGESLREQAIQLINKGITSQTEVLPIINV